MNKINLAALPSSLPAHGKVDCKRCFGSCSKVEFDTTRRTEGSWRITSNPLAWGNPEAEIVLLGFSKGPTQAGALGSTPHDAIAYKGSRTNVGKILRRVGLLGAIGNEDLSTAVDELIADRAGRYHCGSLIRCTVEQLKDGKWIATGGGMLDKFVATPFGQEISGNCTTRMLGNLSPKTKLVVMFGMGSRQAYVRSAFDLYNRSLGGTWRWINDVSYTNGKLTVVHVEHFASQGHHLPSWLGENNDGRAALGKLAQQGVAHALGNVNAHVWPSTSPVPKEGPHSAPVAASKAKTLEVCNPTLAASPEPAAVTPKVRTSKGVDVSTLVSDAEDFLFTQFARLRPANKYIATFRTPNGRHLALSRDLKTSIKVWVEGFPKAGLPGVLIDNTKFPGKPYSSGQPRNSNINFAGSRLAVGNDAYYLHVETLGALERLAKWYLGD